MTILLRILSFFIYCGFYSILALLISAGMNDFSRSVTVPLRISTTLVMLYVLFRKDSSLKFEKNDRWILGVFILFWIIYFFKVFFHHCYDYALYRIWWEYIFYALSFTILPFLVAASIDLKRYRDEMLSAIIFSGFVLGLISMYLYGKMLLIGVGRISMARYADSSLTAETLSPLALSYGGSLTLSLCLHSILFNRKSLSKPKLLYLIISMILSVAMFLLGASRGSVLALLSSLVLMLVYFRGTSRRLLIRALALIAPALLYAANATGSSVFTRVLISSQNRSLTEREILWRDAWNEFLRHPFAGGMIEIDFYPHNIYLEVLMSTGLLGFTLFGVLLFVGLKKIHRLSLKNSEFLWVYIIIVQGMVHHLFSGAVYFAILVFFPLGLIYSSKSI